MKLRWILALTAVITLGLTQAHEDPDDPDHTHDEEGSDSGSKDEKKVCTTVSGAAPNLPCIFPFRFNGVTHTTCIWDMAHLTEHKAWCSTLVDDSGHHVGGQGKWGNCGSDCPIPTDTR